MVEEAMRSVVRDALVYTVEHGLPEPHHFYITFRTDLTGVKIPDFLRAQYPKEMTIVLEHQFWELDADDKQFGVTLSFHGQPQRLQVPLVAITAFADPSVPFGLEFRSGSEPAKPDAPEPPPAPSSPPESKPGEVVKLDAFRKK